MNRKFCLLILLSFCFVSAFSYYAPSDSFRFEGTLKCGPMVVPGMLMNVYLDGKKVKSVNSGRQGYFVLYFAHNKQYTVELIKKDYIIQKVIIDTKVSDGLLRDRGIEMAIDNEIPVFEYYEGIKTELFDNPVLYFVYNENSSFFEQDKKKSLASKLTSITAKISAQKNKDSQNAQKQAVALEKKNMLEDALVVYNKALELAPNNQMLQDKIKELTKRIKSGTNNLEKNYKQFVSAGDELLSAKKYKEATEQYKKASALKPEQKYPKDQLVYIDSVVSLIYGKNKTEYEKFKKSGNTKYKNKEYEGALADYESALALLPEEPVVTKLIKNTRAAIEAEKKKADAEQAAKLADFLKKAGDYMNRKDYNNAIVMYGYALEIKPGDAEILKNKENAARLSIELARERLKKNFNDTLLLADSCFKIKSYEAALAFYKAALNIFPDEENVVKKIKDTENKLKVRLKAETLPAKQDTTVRPGKNSAKIDDQNTDAISGLKTKALELQQNNNLAQALDQLQIALKASQKTGDKNVQAEVLNQMASVYYDSGMYKMSLKSFENALDIKKEQNDKSGMAAIYSEIATAYNYTYQFDNSLEALQNALKLYQGLNNPQAKAETYSKMANILDKKNDYRKSTEYLKLAVKEAQAAGDPAMISSLTNNLGVMYYKMGKNDMAVQYYNQVIASGSKSGNKQNLSLAYNNLGNVNFDLTRFDEAITFYQKSLSIKKELNFEEGVAVSLLNIGSTYLQMKKPIEAAQFLNSGLNLALRLNFRDVIKSSWQALALLYERQNDTPNALKAYKELASFGTIAIKGPINETENMYVSESKIIRQLKKELIDQKILTENEALQNKQKEQQLIVKELQLSEQKTKNARNTILLIFSIAVAATAGLLAFQFFKRYVEKRKYSEIIEFQKRQITDSIEYAGRIQSAVMPPIDFVKTIFPESFILNKPKDIVSGDFYLISVIEEKLYVAVADCTGHGVPGAFMSMLGYTLSKEVIQMQDKSPGAAQTLNLLRDALMKSLHQTGKDDEAKDGMDIALCIIDQKRNTMEYSGANNPCYIVRNNELIELKPDRMPIGIHPVLNPFTALTFDLKKNDHIYLFSDGFRDQISGNTLKKFKKEQFTKLLVEINGKTMNEQLEILNKNHIDWKGNMEQTDDIMVLGIKVS